MRQLTRRQLQWLVEFERLTHLTDGVPPTVREMMFSMGCTSSSTAYYHLEALVRKGCLRWYPYRGFWPLSYRALYAKELVHVG